jgi:hypothetical protein
MIKRVIKKEERKRKRMKKASGFIVGLVLAAGFSACNTGGGPGAALPAAQGTARVSLSLAGLEIPHDYFTRYALSFTPDSGQVPDPVAITEGADRDVTLTVGTYTISAAAIKDTAEIAIGRVEGIVVTEGGSVEAAIVLGPKTGSGGGTFSYSIDLTGVTGLDGGKGSLFITPAQGGGLTIIDLPQGQKTESDSLAFPAGSYSVGVSLTKGTRSGGFSGEALHIYAGLGSALPPRTFTDDDDSFALTVVSASLDLGGLFAAPAVNETPGTGFNAGQYVGAILWSPAITTGGKFAASETYTAHVTLTPAVGYTFAGAALAGLVYDGAGSVGTGALQDNGTVTVSIVFNPTGALGSVTVGAAFFHEEMAVSGYADSLVIPRNGSVTFSVSGYDGVKWYLGLGALTQGLSDGGASITLNGAELAPGRHRLTVTGAKHGKPYSRLLEFTVTDEDELVAPADLAAYLTNLSGGETPDKPVTVALAPFDVKTDTWGITVVWALYYLDKYITLDLSACFAANNTITGGPGGNHNDFNAIKNSNTSREHIVGIILPDSLTTIGVYALYGMGALKSVVIPAGVTTIGNYAFRGCAALTGITIPAGVSAIGNGTFDGCSSLTTVIFAGNNTAINNTNSFPNDLKAYYDQQNVKAGTYILSGGSWTKTE